MYSAWATSSKSKKIIKMNYANYDKSIVEGHKCKIIGWVGPFVNPSEIGSIQALRDLRNVWASGAARWIRLSSDQVKAHMAEIEVLRERGEITVKVRKQRSDAGKSRGGKRKLSDKENMHRHKTAKRARTQLPPKSKELISDSEDEEGDDDESADGEDGDDE